MAVYNKEEYVAKSIESMLNQSFSNFEFIIVDDGSNDNSPDIIKKYAKQDSRISLIQNDANLGLPVSLNIGINAARGKYIARQDADDISKPDRLEEQLKIMENNRDIALLGAADELLDIDDIVFSKQTYDEGPNSPNHQNIIKTLENKGGYIFAHGSAFYRKEVVKKIGGYEKTFIYSQDIELWWRFHKNNYKIAYLNKTLYSQRIVPEKFRVKSVYQGKFKNYLQDKIQLDNYHFSDIDVILNSLIKARGEKDKFIDSYYLSNYWFILSKKIALNKGNLKYFIKYLSRALRERNMLRTKMYKLLGCIYLYLFHRTNRSDQYSENELIYLN
ncbi:glycosyltransferase family 2 protein [Candidatus Marinimicrobia bacterium MT.SAG.3]|nr:glycosyltransferase family 2 protein [Candidatus Marinimicrobia bacterium MT.SAG.3]